MRKALLLGAGALVLAGCGAPGNSPSAGTTPVTTMPSTATAGTLSSPGTAPSASASTPTMSTLQQAFETVRSGVVRFEVAGCGTAWQGSGFQLSPDLIATVAHVVDQGQVIRVIEGTTSTAGTVIGLDQGTDVALVRTA